MLLEYLLEDLCGQATYGCDSVPGNFKLAQPGAQALDLFVKLAVLSLAIVPVMRLVPDD